ncbi:MAG: hypothetical protein VR64_00530 [Desulfatitalea sp. BRH_c12]|nr:MAG: hypothetical protein VR64_00530 [Desulfatitalea sp. BRH_c12]
MKILSVSLIVLFVAAASLVVACSDNEKQTAQQNAPTEEQRAVQPGEGNQQQTAPPEITQPQAQPDTAQEQSEAQPEPMQTTEGDQVEVAGTVERNADGFVIRSNDELFNVVDRDLSDMVGKHVRASGTLKESGGTRTLKINEVQPIE